MGTKDFFDLFKLSILKNSRFYLLLICWLVGFAYLPRLLSLLHLAFLARLQEQFPGIDDWVIPMGVLRFVFWVLAFLLIKELFDQFIAFTKRGGTYKFTSDSWYKDWIFNGKTRLLEAEGSILQVNSSRAGCLLDRYLWKNFEMKFNMRFIETKKIGIVFRAEDLENYFMLQLRKEAGSINIVPYVRYSGMWEGMNKDKLGIDNNSEWLKVKLQVKDNKALLSVDGVGIYTWNLPTHVDINHIEFGIRKNQNSNPSSGEDFAAKVTYLPRIPFRDAFGRVGFRAHLDEGAEIKNLEVKNI